MNDVYMLIEHLRDCPTDFLKESIFTDPEKGLDTNALVLDLYRGYSSTFWPVIDLIPGKEKKVYSKDHLIAIHMAVWFFSSELFLHDKKLLTGIQIFMFEQLRDLSEYVKYDRWLEDEDRSEEFVRTALMACEIWPHNESQTEAMDRLESISILKRNKVLSRSKEAFERIMEIRKKMAEQKAREAANVYGRE